MMVFVAINIPIFANVEQTCKFKLLLHSLSRTFADYIAVEVAVRRSEKPIKSIGKFVSIAPGHKIDNFEEIFFINRARSRERAQK